MGDQSVREGGERQPKKDRVKSWLEGDWDGSRAHAGHRREDETDARQERVTRDGDVVGSRRTLTVALLPRAVRHPSHGGHWQGCTAARLYASTLIRGPPRPDGSALAVLRRIGDIWGEQVRAGQGWRVCARKFNLHFDLRVLFTLRAGEVFRAAIQRHFALPGRSCGNALAFTDSKGGRTPMCGDDSTGHSGPFAWLKHQGIEGKRSGVSTTQGCKQTLRAWTEAWAHRARAGSRMRRRRPQARQAIETEYVNLRNEGGQSERRAHTDGFHRTRTVALAPVRALGRPPELRWTR
ncbi:hypothetical protein C8Q79DRAFT_722114 [Trametes meyenii]|nr:hypothetical protein C8Q79DRAFT_722114 [Trametes meyenii]